MKKLISITLLLITIFTYSQKVKLAEGDVKRLKGITAYNVVFEYTNLKIPNFETEEDFLKDKMEKREKLKPNTGAGERFRKSWFADREELFEPYFINYFNGYFVMKKKIVAYKNNTESKYTMLIKTDEIYAGYNVGVFSESAKSKTVITIYETKNPKNILFKSKQIAIKNGRSSFNSGVRIANTYGILGESMARFLRKKAF